MKDLIDSLRTRRWSHLIIANLRIMLGFAFVPSGLKKVLHQPFTDPQNTGAFHDFLHMFYATGVFYQFVGGVQLLIAALLMTQIFATLGALMALPVITCITVFCWSTGVIPTAIVATMMLSGTLVLVLWDVDRWLAILRPAVPSPAVLSPRPDAPAPDTTTTPPIELSLWRTCGTGILVFYGLTCIVYGGIYRPRGLELSHPAFYMFPLIALFPIVTLLVEQRRRARR